MGKVHGSLARAGKVKSQTPKVEKQEKKKQPKGRAKKRMQYHYGVSRAVKTWTQFNLTRTDPQNRRFVNVTLAPGGKRRMNQQPPGKSG